MSTDHLGPLADQRLEQIAFDIFSFRFPLAEYYDNLRQAERSDCRRIALRMAARLTPAWTVEDAVEQLTDRSCELLFGDRLPNTNTRGQVKDYAESYVEDLAKLFGGDALHKNSPELYQPHEEPEYEDEGQPIARVN